MMISCLTVTEKRPQFLARAIACFDRQTYTDKELVLLIQESDTLTLDFIKQLHGRKDIRISTMSGNKILGERRNASVDEARGEYVAVWDDDDFYHPDRLLLQMKRIEQTGKAACCLGRSLILRGETAAISRYRPCENSLLCQKSKLPRYPALQRLEDTTVVLTLSQRAELCLLDRPELYVYQFHGGNTMGAEVFNIMLKDSSPVPFEYSPMVLEAIRSTPRRL